MFSFPDDYEEGWTLQNEIKKDGIGLHTGLKCTVIIKPTESKGFHISFSNEPNKVTPIEKDYITNILRLFTRLSKKLFIIKYCLILYRMVQV